MRASRLLAGLPVALVCLTSGCGESESHQEADPTSAVVEQVLEVDSYDVRAVITQLPSADNPSNGFMAHHEAIPEFRSQNGAMGMKEMTMGFPVAQDLDLSGFAVDQKVTITFTVDYDTANKRLLGFRATKLVLLPDDTVLHFGQVSE